MYSTLKLLLTGVDDSSLVSSSKVVHVSEDASSKVELIDQWLANLRGELEDIGADRKEIETQLERLESASESQRMGLNEMQKRMDDSVVKRRDMHKEREKIKGRIDEISELMVRFELLTQHYAVDIERLEAIEESGSLFFHQEKAPCPLCGAPVVEQHLEKACQKYCSVRYNLVFAVRRPILFCFRFQFSWIRKELREGCAYSFGANEIILYWRRM